MRENSKSQEIATLGEIFLRHVMPESFTTGMPAFYDLYRENFREDVAFQEVLHRFVEQHLSELGNVNWSKLSVQKIDEIIESLIGFNSSEDFGLAEMILERYYTHPKVVYALTGTAEAPFPSGKQLKSNDFEILEPVFNRGVSYKIVE